jgi:hypothetical protein
MSDDPSFASAAAVGITGGTGNASNGANGTGESIRKEPPWGGERRWDRVIGLQSVSLRESLRSPDRIRLLLLYPPRWSDTGSGSVKAEEDRRIKCDVYQISLTAVTTTGRPMLMALSYRWGADRTTHIKCDGVHVAVRHSLYEALLYIRHAARPRLVWIDSLCIN